MSAIVRNGVLLLGAVLSMDLGTQAQQKTASTYTTDVDIAITYVAERAKLASVDCGCFWLNGGSGNAAMTLFHGLGVAANLTGEQASNIGTGINLDKVMFVVGPRYTYSPKLPVGKRPGIAVFGEGLFGGMHGFNSTFPSSSGTTGAASSFATQFGGGLDLRFARHIGIRAVEVDYVRSALPNNAGNVQNDLRLAGGISFHFSPKP
jgi:hypothetical protein